MSLPGHRILASLPSVPQDVIEAFRGAPVANVSDNMNRLHGTRHLRPIHRSGYLVGTAVTVKTRPGDNQAIHQAYGILRPGDVLVVDGGAETSQGLVGEIMLRRAQAIGIAGMVIDGAVRDVDAFKTSDFPCFARSETHRGPYKSGPGEINIPVAIDGMVVMPGDIVLGDRDGVVAFGREHASELIALVRSQQEREVEMLKDIAKGRPNSPYFETPAKPGA